MLFSTLPSFRRKYETARRNAEYLGKVLRQVPTATLLAQQYLQDEYCVLIRCQKRGLFCLSVLGVTYGELTSRCCSTTPRRSSGSKKGATSSLFGFSNSPRKLYIVRLFLASRQQSDQKSKAVRKKKSKRAQAAGPSVYGRSYLPPELFFVTPCVMRAAVIKFSGNRNSERNLGESCVLLVAFPGNVGLVV